MKKIVVSTMFSHVNIEKAGERRGETWDLTRKEKWMKSPLIENGYERPGRTVDTDCDQAEELMAGGG